VELSKRVTPPLISRSDDPRRAISQIRSALSDSDQDPGSQSLLAQRLVRRIVGEDRQRLVAAVNVIGARRKSSLKPDQRPTSLHHGSLAGAFSNKEKL
jgi:hypothetical protein